MSLPLPPCRFWLRALLPNSGRVLVKHMPTQFGITTSAHAFWSVRSAPASSNVMSSSVSIHRAMWSSIVPQIIFGLSSSKFRSLQVVRKSSDFSKQREFCTSILNCDILSCVHPLSDVGKHRPTDHFRSAVLQILQSSRPKIQRFFETAGILHHYPQMWYPPLCPSVERCGQASSYRSFSESRSRSTPRVTLTS